MSADHTPALCIRLRKRYTHLQSMGKAVINMVQRSKSALRLSNGFKVVSLKTKFSIRNIKL